MFYTSSEIIFNVTSVLSQGSLTAEPKNGSLRKKFNKNKGSSLVKVRSQKHGLQTRFQTQKYGTHIPVNECYKTPPPPRVVNIVLN